MQSIIVYVAYLNATAIVKIGIVEYVQVAIIKQHVLKLYSRFIITQLCK